MSSLFSPRTLSICFGVCVAAVTSNLWASPTQLSSAQLKPLTEAELSAETVAQVSNPKSGINQSLKMRVLHIERDLHGADIPPNFAQNLDILPAPEMPDTSGVSPLMQQHVANIAAGLQSADPREGLYIMLAPFGIDRNATNVQTSREQFSQNNPFPVPSTRMR